MKKINVTKTFLPPIEEYEEYLREIWQSGQLTNQGPLLKTFEKEITAYLNVENFHFVSNGTIALQLALKTLDIIDGEIITTPFSYVATTSAILWERCTPVFVDILPDTLCVNTAAIEAAITENTRAIMPVHVFGNPCDVEEIDRIAKKHNLKVIYDAAHAFGVTYKGRSLLSYGDISVCSFHATKLFHTIEGGCIITKDSNASDTAELIKRFGHNGDEHYMLGINAKASEFQAAMGLCNLKHVEANIEARKSLSELYDSLLNNKVSKQKKQADTAYNYAYYPVLFENERELLIKLEELQKRNIYPRRYFYPSLNRLPYLDNGQSCPVSEDISKRILCLPLYYGLEDSAVREICEVINT